MGQFEDLRTFLQIIEHGSISKAAAKMHVAKSAVSRRLSLLEARYGAVLIDRAPGAWALSKTGQELYQRAVRLVGEFEEIDADFLNTSAAISGPLSISVPHEFGISYLNDALLSFKEKYPQIHLIINFDDHAVDLSREDYDFALRITAHLKQGTKAVQIGAVDHRLYASVKYLKARGEPKCLDDLRAHHLLYFGDARRAVWEFTTHTGNAQKIAFHPFLNSNSGMFLLNATLKGLGISRLPSFIASKSAERGDIVEVLRNFVIPKWGIYLVHSEKRLINRRMRLFSEMMAHACLHG